MDGARHNEKTWATQDVQEGEAWDEKPLAEGSRVIRLARETDSFSEVRRKRVNEYGKEIRESKVGI